MKKILYFAIAILCLALSVLLSSCIYILPGDEPTPTASATLENGEGNVIEDQGASDGSENQASMARAAIHETEEDDGDCTTSLSCLNCGTIVVRAQTHNFTGDWIGDESGHYRPCVHDGCTVHKPTENHIGGTANCVSGRICKVCGCEYTDINPDNHVGFDSVTGECECGELAEARVSDVSYETLHEAIRNWTDGTTLVLLQDVEYDSLIYVSNKTVVLDLNGKTLKHSGEPIESFVTVLSSGSLTIDDGIGGGKIAASGYAVDVYGNLCFLNGEISGQVGIEAHTGSKVEISGNSIIKGASEDVNVPAYSIEIFSGADVTVSGTPTFDGDIFTRTVIVFNTRSSNDEAWGVYMNSPGAFARTGDDFTLDESKFVSSVDGYVVQRQEDGTLALVKN